jgi:putative DNA primase/helicase
MPLPDEQKRSRAQQEYQFLATILRSPEKLPLVIGRLNPARFEVPIIAQIVKAIAESCAACGCLSLDDLKSRLTPHESAELDTVMSYSTVMADDAEILAVLDRAEGTACEEAPARSELVQARPEPSRSGPIHGSTARPTRTAGPTRTNVRGPHAGPPLQSSREEIERGVMAALVSTRRASDLGRLDPKLFEMPHLARIAAAMVRRFHMLGFVRLHELISDLSEEDQKLVYEFNRTAPLWPSNVDIIAVLTGQLPLPPAETKTSSAQAQPCCAPLTQFEAEPRRWLWPERMELGRLILIGGEVGSGKSLVACDLAARTTTGGPWPDGAAGSPPGSVLLVAPGDDVSDQIRPRLEAAGADIERISVLAFDPTGPARRDDSPFRALLKAIEGAIEELVDCRLVVIDPLRLSIGRTATTVEGDPKARLGSLVSLARRQQVAVLGVAIAAHEDRRRTTFGDALKLATAGCAATAWQVVRHPFRKQARWFLPIKTTRTCDDEGLWFTVTQEDPGERLKWQDERVTLGLVDAHPRGDAADWLRQALSCGPLPAKEILLLGGQNGYTPRMLHYAKAAAGVAVRHEGIGPGQMWRWTLIAPSNVEGAKTA